MRKPNFSTPQQAHDHTLGTGALCFDWWLHSDCSSHDCNEPGEEWRVELVIENPTDEGVIAKSITNQDIVDAAWKIITEDAPEGHPHEWVNPSMIRECGTLLFNPDYADFDAPMGDALLQVAMLGYVPFG
jgi:hypothetical protein